MRGKIKVEKCALTLILSTDSGARSMGQATAWLGAWAEPSGQGTRGRAVVGKWRWWWQPPGDAARRHRAAGRAVQWSRAEWPVSAQQAEGNGRRRMGAR
jgi:hypothetical protein